MKQLAIMTAPKFGMRDMSRPGFWFTVSFGEELSSGALIILPTDEMSEIIKDHTGVYDMSKLDGAPCQIDVTDNIVTFVKVLEK